MWTKSLCYAYGLSTYLDYDKRKSLENEENILLQISLTALRAHLRHRNAIMVQHVHHFLDILIDPKPDGGVVVMYL